MDPSISIFPSLWSLKILLYLIKFKAGPAFEYTVSSDSQRKENNNINLRNNYINNALFRQQYKQYIYKYNTYTTIQYIRKISLRILNFNAHDFCCKSVKKITLHRNYSKLNTINVQSTACRHKQLATEWQTGICSQSSLSQWLYLKQMCKMYSEHSQQYLRLCTEEGSSSSRYQSASNSRLIARSIRGDLCIVYKCCPLKQHHASQFPMQKLMLRKFIRFTMLNESVIHLYLQFYSKQDVEKVRLDWQLLRFKEIS